MAYSQSGRPETSVPASSEPAQVPAEHPQVGATDDRDGLYVPHLFDFVTLAGQAKRVNQSSIPPLFLESQAVDTSSLIGDGASFSASRRRLPQAESTEYTTRHGGLIVTAQRGAQARPDYVVYKTARVAFTPTGEPVARDRRAMSSAMMEFYALIHKPLYEHPNVIDYLGLAWGSNPFEPLHKLPIIVVEYAEHGTLSDLQAKEDLTSSVKHNLCLDVALGLDILHRCGIVHGDVKAENVLIFSHPEKRYLAKVADFGFSVVEAVASPTINIGGTRPWKAPETRFPVAKDQLKLTDVYSFGLLVWRVATDGRNPFDLVVPADFRGEQYSAEIERLKETDELIVRSRLRSWYVSHVTASPRFEQSPLPSAELVSKLQACLANPALLTTASDDLDLLLSRAMSSFSSLGLPTDLVEKTLLEKVLHDSFYGCFDRIMESCLDKSPRARDLAAAILVLQTRTRTNADIPNNQNLVLKTSYDHHLISWQQMRDLEPSVQNVIFNVFLSRSQKDANESKVNPPATFALASFYINGYGTEPNHEEAARLLLHAAKWGHKPSKAYVYRICRALSDQFSATDSVITDLVDMSLSGSRLALHDLEQVSPDKVPFIRCSLKDFLAGTGANFFYSDQMLYGPLRGYWTDVFTSKALLAQKLETMNNIQEFRLNKRGDRLLHVAASCGKQDAVKILLTAYSIDINQCNDQGETALLCACRAGQVEVAHLLLSRGADSSITTQTKESPLHWLISFSSDDIETLGATLIASGADVRITTNKDVSYSVFPSGIDVDHLTLGTPLDWAVHHDRPDIVKFLLESAGDPRISLIRASDPRPNAPLWAAHYHHTECLKLMVEAIEGANKESNETYIYGPLFGAAAHSADLFSMILRHGSEYKVRLKATLDYLLVKSKNTHFATGIGSFGHTLLYNAVTEAHDAVVEYLLSPETQNLLGLQQLNPVSLQPESPELESTGELNVGDLPGAFKPEDVNLACGSEKRTPILESVRWNRRPLFQMLSEHGGDARATSRNPFTKDRIDWTGLHIFAYAGHNSGFGLVHDLVRAGVPVDGRSAGSTKTETPLTVAIQNNAFELASTLIHIGADINAQSLSSGLIAGDYPLTILGQIIASTARYSTPRLRYILFECAVQSEVDFIVEPERKLTALHRAAWAYPGLLATSSDSDELKSIRRGDCDMTTNRDIMYELLQRFNTPEQLNMRCRVLGRTALHLAVDVANVGALKELVDRGADKEVLDDLGETPASLTERLLLSKEDRDWREAEMKEILRILQT